MHGKTQPSKQAKWRKKYIFSTGVCSIDVLFYTYFTNVSSHIYIYILKFLSEQT
jgi:hypothetical protein